jgi:hypothetical protein
MALQGFDSVSHIRQFQRAFENLSRLQQISRTTANFQPIPSQPVLAQLNSTMARVSQVASQLNTYPARVSVPGALRSVMATQTAASKFVQRQERVSAKVAELAPAMRHYQQTRFLARADALSKRYQQQAGLLARVNEISRSVSSLSTWPRYRKRSYDFPAFRSVVRAATAYGPVVVTPDGPPPEAPDVPPTYVPALESLVPDTTSPRLDEVAWEELWEAIWEDFVLMAQEQAQRRGTNVMLRVMKNPIVIGLVVHNIIQFLRYVP